MLRVGIIDDDAGDTERLKAALLRYEKETGEKLDIVCFDDGAKLIGNYKKGLDVLFLDIEMPGVDGMSLATKIREADENVAIIFVTNFSGYAVEGYRVNAMDYFLKPVTYGGVRFRMEQVRMRAEERLPVIMFTTPGGEIKRMATSRIYYIEIMDHEVTYHTVSGNYSVSRGESLKQMEKQLARAGFARCSASYLVNLMWCRDITGDELLVGGDKIKISRRMKKDFMAALGSSVTKQWEAGE